MTKINKDIFESAFNDYLEGQLKNHIIVHTNISEKEKLPVQYFFRSNEQLPELEKIALNLCSGKILDIGAGAGCHSFILQKNGFDVTAIDISPGAVKTMQQIGIRNTKCIDFFAMETEKFDTILILMDSIGLVKKLSGLTRFFKKCRSLLNSEGKIILDSADLMHHFMDAEGYARLDANAGYYGEINYCLEYKEKMGKPFKWLFVDFSNLSWYAEKAGFTSELIYEDNSFNYLAELTIRKT